MEIKYIVIDWQDPDKGDYYKEYFTIYNGQTITITLDAYYTPVTAPMAVVLKHVVDDISFTQTLKKPMAGIEIALWVSLCVIVLVVIGVFIYRRIKKNKHDESYIEDEQAVLQRKEQKIAEMRLNLEKMENKTRSTKSDTEIRTSKDTEKPDLDG